MPQEITKRYAIIDALCTGRTAKEIIDFSITTRTLFIESKSNLKLACDDLETFTGERKTHKRHSDAIRSPKFVT